MIIFPRQRKVKISWSPNFAYAIGLITSDGNLSSDRRHISLKSADLELTRNLKLALSLKNKISTRIRYRDKLQKHFEITFGDVEFYRFLNTIGLQPRKSKIIEGVLIPEKFFADFLRGLFDGDGTFYSSWDRRWPNSLVFQASFASASYIFIHWLKSTLTQYYGVKGFVRNGDGVFNLRYVKRDTVALFRVMYHRKDLLRLNRKFLKMKTVLLSDPNIRTDAKAAVAQW